LDEGLLPDVTFSSAAASLGQITTPVPGGVGPNPVMVLFENVIARAEENKKRRGDAIDYGQNLTQNKVSVDSLY